MGIKRQYAPYQQRGGYHSRRRNDGRRGQRIKYLIPQNNKSNPPKHHGAHIFTTIKNLIHQRTTKQQKFILSKKSIFNTLQTCADSFMYDKFTRSLGAIKK